MILQELIWETHVTPFFDDRLNNCACPYEVASNKLKIKSNFDFYSNSVKCVTFLFNRKCMYAVIGSYSGQRKTSLRQANLAKPLGFFAFCRYASLVSFFQTRDLVDVTKAYQIQLHFKILMQCPLFLGGGH